MVVLPVVASLSVFSVIRKGHGWKFLAFLMRLLKIPNFWEWLHYVKGATERFFPRNPTGKMVTN